MKSYFQYKINKSIEVNNINENKISQQNKIDDRNNILGRLNGNLELGMPDML